MSQRGSGSVCIDDQVGPLTLYPRIATPEGQEDWVSLAHCGACFW